MINYKAIGRRIKEYRKANNITQEKFAESISISTEYLSRIETGAIHLSLNLIQIICEKIGCDEQELMFGTKPSVDNDSIIAKRLSELNSAQQAAVISIIDIIADL